MDYAKQYQEYLARANQALEKACETFLPEESKVCRAARYSLLAKAIQKIIADHVSDGHALTAEKRTLLHNAAAFNAVEAGSYVLDDELQRLIGKRAADFYEYAISQKNGCLVCSIYFQNLLKKNGIDFEHFAFTPKEEILIE